MEDNQSAKESADECSLHSSDILSQTIEINEEKPSTDITSNEELINDLAELTLKVERHGAILAENRSILKANADILRKLNQNIDILIDTIEYQTRNRNLEILKLVQSWKLIFPSKDIEANEFIGELNRKLRALNLSEEELLNILPEFFVKNAKIWCCNQLRIWFSWEDFEKSFKIYFCDIKDDDELWVEIYNSHQHKRETGVEFIIRMQKLYNKMLTPRPLKTQIYYIIKGLNAEFKSWRMITDIDNINSYEKLVHIVRHIEAMLNESSKN